MRRNERKQQKEIWQQWFVWASRGRPHISLLQKSCCLPLLLSLISSCLCSLEVNVSRSFYQAEENSSVTLEWTFSPKTNLTSLEIFCGFFSPHGEDLLYHVSEGAEVPLNQDGHFRGRVQSDKDALRGGRVSLRLSPLSQDDSGVYQCNFFSNAGRNSGFCRLNVTAPADHKLGKPEETPAETSAAPTRGRLGLYLGLSLLAAAGFSTI